MTGHRTRLGPGYRERAGKIERTTAHLDVSTRLKKQASKKVRVVKPKTEWKRGLAGSFCSFCVHFTKEDAMGFAGKCAVHSFHTFGFNSCEQWKGA